MVRCVVGLFVGMLCVAQQGGPVLAQARPNLVGTWKLNADLTTHSSPGFVNNAPTVGRRTPIGGSGMPMGGGRGPASAGAGYPGRSENPNELAKTREAMRLATLTPERLSIVRSGEILVVTDDDGISQKLTPDGKTTKSTVGALEVETKVKWEDEVLVVERKFEGNVKIVERYSVRESPRQLVVSAKVENNRLPGDRSRTFQRVYDIQK